MQGRPLIANSVTVHPAESVRLFARWQGAYFLLEKTHCGMTYAFLPNRPIFRALSYGGRKNSSPMVSATHGSMGKSTYILPYTPLTCIHAPSSPSHAESKRTQTRPSATTPSLIVRLDGPSTLRTRRRRITSASSSRVSRQRHRPPYRVLSL